LQTLTYKYLVFAKEVGKYEIKLEPTMLFTSQSAIDNVIEGRDNVNDLEVERQEVKLKTIFVTVNETSSALSGSLTLIEKLDLLEVAAYEPVHLEIALKGEGNLQAISSLNFEIQGVKVFRDKAEKNFELNENGYKGIWLQRFAFVASSDFIIPSKEFKYFDLKEKKEKILKTKVYKVHVKVDGIKRENLIDEVNLPSSKINFSLYLSYLYYILSFIAGFIIAKLVKLPSRTTVKFKKGEKIKRAKNAKELLEVLIFCEKGLFAKEILELEEAVYKNESIKLSKIKKETLKKL